MSYLKKDSIPYFRELSNSQLEKIEKISKRYSCKNGDVVYLQGEFCLNWVIVEEGSFLTRKKEGDSVIDERIILEGENFDFESTIRNSITSSSLEAIGNSSILVIDILGLKYLAKKSPVLTSLIKLQLNEEESILWSETIMKGEKRFKSLHIKVKQSILWSFLKTLPLFILMLIINILFLLFLKRFTPLIYLGTVLLYISIFISSYIFSKFSYLEFDRDIAVKKEFEIRKLALTNSSIPLEKILSSKVNFSKRLHRVLNIGQITVESANSSLVLDGVYRPNDKVKILDDFKHSIVDVDKAIELSSFKYLLSRQNNIFCLDSQIERDENSIFTFRKSILYFLVRSLPPFILFLATSVLLCMLFRNIALYLINIPSVLVCFWLYIDWINDRYAFEGNKVIDIEKKPLFGKEIRIEADITSIQSVKKEQKNIFEILFNFGNIEITTIGGKIIYPSINNPDKVIDNLYLIKKYYVSKEESKNRMARQEEFLNYTKYYQELTKREN